MAMDQSDAPDDTKPRRRLTTVLAADLQGFSSTVESDEEEGLRAVAMRISLLEASVAAHGGRIFHRAGDGRLAEFASPVAAVRAGLEAQHRFLEAFGGALRLGMRIGIHTGDVVAEADGDLMGHGVNVAARLEAACPVGAVLASDATWDHAKAAITANAEGPVRIALGKMQTRIVAWRLFSAGAVRKAPRSRRFIHRSPWYAIGVLVSAVAVCVIWFAMRSDVTRNEGTRPTRNDALVARAEVLVRQRGEGALRQAIALLNQAVAHDPSDARAWAELANAHFSMLTFSEAPDAAHAESGRAAARRALQLDPALPEAVMALARDQIGAGQRTKGMRTLEAGLAATPDDVDLILALGFRHAQAGRYVKARNLARRALALDPDTGLTIIPLGMNMLFSGDAAAADMLLRRAWEDFALRAPVIRRGLALIALQRGDPDGARLWLGDGAPATASDAFAAATDAMDGTVSTKFAAERVTQAYRAHLQTDPFAFETALDALGFLGEVESAASLLSEAEPDGDTATYTLFAPWNTALRRSEAFAETMAVLGLERHWRETTPSDECVGEGAEDFPYCARIAGAP